MEGARVSYRIMRCSIPEGGEVVLYWPDGMGMESFEMARQMLEIQMRVFRRGIEAEEAAALRIKQAMSAPEREGQETNNGR